MGLGVELACCGEVDGDIISHKLCHPAASQRVGVAAGVAATLMSMLNLFRANCRECIWAASTPSLHGSSIGVQSQQFYPCLVLPAIVIELLLALDTIQATGMLNHDCTSCENESLGL